MKATVSHFDDLDLFRGLSHIETSEIAANFTHETIEGGEVLLRQGDEAQRLYIVVSGRFSVSQNSGPTLAVITRGEPVGEIAFFNRGTRTADVTALRDSEVLSIDRADFDSLADVQPVLWRSIVLALTDRLQRATATAAIRTRTPAQPRTIVLCPAGEGEVSKKFALSLVDALQELGTTVRLLDEDTVRAETGDAAVNSSETNRWLNEQEAIHDVTLWLTGATTTEWAQKAVRQADAAVMVTTTAPHTLSPIEAMVSERLNEKDIRLAVTGGRASDWLAHRTAGASHRTETAEEIRSLARFLCGRARGLVLGGGGALAGAHVGVVFALREAGLDFDSFAGTSAGAAIAGALALGQTREEVIDHCEDIFLTHRALKRWTIPKYGMIDPAVVDEMLRHHYGIGPIEDLPFPFRAIATDLSDNSTHEINRGPLWEAIRASCSLPILLPPFIDGEGRILVDGGITDNLPVDPILASKRGPNAAIILGPARWRRAAFQYGDYPSRGALLREKLTPWRKPSLKAPRLGQIVTRSMLLASDAASQEALHRTDLVFQPPIPKGMGIIDWKRFRSLERDTYDWARGEIEQRISDDPTAFDAFR